MSEHRFDVVIAGGGMAGLTAAAYIARSGKSVVVCEKEPHFGGLVRSFERNGVVYDGGIRSIENSGIVFPMLRQLGIEMEFVDSPVSLGVEENVVRLHEESAVEEYRRFLLELFAGSERDVELVVAEIRAIMKYMEVLYGIDNPAFLDLKRDREYLVKTIVPWMFRYMLTAPKISRLQEPVVEFLQRRTTNPVLLDIIAQHFFRSTPTFFALSYISLYLDYHYPLGGTGTLPRRMVEFIRDHDGTLHPDTEITSVDPEERIVSTASGTTYRYSQLIWACDLKRLYASIEPDALSIPKLRETVVEQRSRLDDKRGGDSVFTLYLAADLPASYFSGIATGHFFYTPRKEGLSRVPPFVAGSQGDLEEWLTAFFAMNTFEISIPALRDPSLAPPGRTGLVVSTLFDYDVARHAEQIGWYDGFKSFCEQSIIDCLDSSIYPGIGKAVAERFSSTPLSIARATGNTDGAITGWAFTNDVMPAENRLPRILSATRTPLPCVSQAGQWSYSPSGLPISILTGKFAADRAIHGLRRRDGSSRRTPTSARRRSGR